MKTTCNSAVIARGSKKTKGLVTSYLKQRATCMDKNYFKS